MNEILFLRFFTALATTNADDPDIHAANDYAISLVKSNRAALTRAEAAEAAARRESNTAGELLAVIARIGETLGIAMSTPNLCRVVQAEVETVKARAEAAEAEALKQARRAAQARMRHANLLRRRGLEEPLTTVENEAEAAGLRARAEAIEAERDDLRDANGVLSEALEAARQMLVKLSARVAELEAQLAAAGSRVIELEAAQDESYHAYLELKEEADSRGEPLREACRQNMILTARVALAEERTRAAVAASLASAAAVARIGGLLGVDPSLPVEEFRETVIARVAELEAARRFKRGYPDKPGMYIVRRADGTVGTARYYTDGWGWGAFNTDITQWAEMPEGAQP